jgi:chorismate lyase / 3-hydroxybenzoate synthase
VHHYAHVSALPVALLKVTFPRYVSEIPSGILGAVSFGSRLRNGSIHVPLRQLGTSVAEIWPAAADPVQGSAGAFSFAHDGELLFACAAFEETSPIETIARSAYDEAIALAREQGYPNLIRMWNHVGSINEEDRGRERYKLFCEGRHDAFAAAGYTLGADLPSASAVGMPGKGLIVYFIAANEPATQAENPRQVAAYRYPPQYGLKSPSFSRATIRESGRDIMIYVSGTSSVVGHASVHAREVLKQLEETVRNLEAVLEASADASVEDLVAVKTYIRRPEDAAEVIPALDEILPKSCSRIYVEADICRRELLLEIEGVARLTRPSGVT